MENKVIVFILNYDLDEEARKIENSITSCPVCVIDSSAASKNGFVKSDIPFYSGNLIKASEIFLQSDADFALFICSDVIPYVGYAFIAFEKIIQKLKKLPIKTGLYSPQLEGNYHKYWYKTGKCVDGIIFAANRDVIKASLHVFYQSKYGWGLDMYMAFIANKLNCRIAIDKEIVMYHPYPRSYSKSEAEKDLNNFVVKMSKNFKSFCQKELRCLLPFYKRFYYKFINYISGKGYRI